MQVNYFNIDFLDSNKVRESSNSFCSYKGSRHYELKPVVL
uniref:Uncharacterized protein n=1 Tax=Lepeophtheirus salmonis TaxID=72036 RepID=A0A0K2UZ81_LEPSM